MCLKKLFGSFLISGDLRSHNDMPQWGPWSGHVLGTQWTLSNQKLISFSVEKEFPLTYFNNFLPTISLSFLSEIGQSVGAESNGDTVLRVNRGSLSGKVTFAQESK